jgi:methionyl aminopeptidase
VRPGVSTLDVDRFAEERIRAAGGVPAFKGYPHRHDGHDFPGTVCASLNDEVVHGVPRASVVLRDGDILSVDLGILYKGYYGDAAETYPVGAIESNAQRLLDVTRESLQRAIAQAKPGNRVSDIGHAGARRTSKRRDSRSCASSSATASVRTFTKNPRSRTSASRGAACA